MATTFESIYARCRGRIKDYDKEGYTDEMFAAVEKDLLQAAIDDFVDICAKDLTDYDEELMVVCSFIALELFGGQGDDSIKLYRPYQPLWGHAA